MSDYPHTHPVKSKLKHSKIFRRALVGELVSNGFLIFAVLFGIIVVSQLIRLLSDAVVGKIALDGVLVVLGFGAISYFPVLLSLTLFISILLTVSRWYRDSEMVVWFCSGIGLTGWIRPMLWYAIPMVGAIALLSLVLTPWALQKSDEFKNNLERRSELASVTPGVFRESKQADRIYFIENTDVGANRVGNIFVRSERNGKTATMVASQGLQEVAPNGDRFLVLLNGMRYEGVLGQRDYSIVEFERYAIRTEVAQPASNQPWVRTLTTAALLRDRTLVNLSELEWRLGLPISAAILALLAIPLGYVNPRAGRSLNLIMAVILYMVYNNMISVTNTWVTQGTLSPGIGLFGLHSVAFVVAVLMFYRRNNLFSLRRTLGK